MNYPRVRIDDVARIVSGATPSTSQSEYWDGPIKWVTPADLSKMVGLYIAETPRTITEVGLASCSAEVLPPNSVLFSSRAPIGHVAINTVPMATNQGFKSFVPNLKRLDSRFLYFWLRANRAFLESLGNGATFKEVSKAVISRVEIPLPPLAEQRRIAAILDQADALRRKRREAMQKLDCLLDAIFFSSFCGSEADAWPEKLVSELCLSVRTGPFGSQLLHSEFVDEGVAVLGIDNAVGNEFRWAERRFITEQKFRELKRYRVFPRDLLITIMGTCGCAAIVPDDIPVAINTKHLCCLTLDENQCLPEFLHAAFLRHPSILHQMGVRERGAVMAGLNMGLIKELKITVPPIAVQRAFAVRAAEIDKLKTAHRAHLEQLDALFAALQHRAFRGELTAVAQAVNEFA